MVGGCLLGTGAGTNPWRIGDYVSRGSRCVRGSPEAVINYIIGEANVVNQYNQAVQNCLQ